MPANVEFPLHRNREPEVHDATLAPLPRTDEVTELAARDSHDHGADAAAIACLWHLSSKLLTDFGTDNGTDLKPMVDLLQRALRNHAAGAGVSEAQVQGALLDLRRAGETAAYLHSLPD